MKSVFQRSCLVLALSFATSAAFSGALIAQEQSSTKGALAGQITDPTGAVVAGAKVTITGGEGVHTVTTDAAGRFGVGSLTPGLYAVNVEAAGFKADEARNLEVVINRVSSVSLTLQPGAVAETVQVDATTTEIDTGSTAIGANLTDTFYSQVPVSRNVGSLFYVSPGVTNSGTAGNSNPSIGGASGLENSYVADGVDIGDAGYGGLGVFSPIYGSIGTGINLTFIQEVQVKEGAFEPKYGKSNGGVLQIVTKSGGTQFHGALSSFFAPGAMHATDYYADNFFGRQNVHGHISSTPQYDAAAEIGGYVPGRYTHDKLFFYGAFNPALSQVQWLAAPGSGLASHGSFDNSTTAKSWAAKITFHPSDNVSVDASAFGDPSSTNKGLQVASVDAFPLFPNLNQNNEGAFSLWKYGTRSEVVRLTATVSPTWLVNISASAKQAHFTESGFSNDYQIFDYSGAVSASSFNAQGLGNYQNPTSNNYGFDIDTEKTVQLAGTHTFSLGWTFSRAIYDKTNGYSGPDYVFPLTNDIGAPVTNSGLAGTPTSASFNLLAAPASCPLTLCPNYNGTQVFLQQSRGIFSTPHDFSSSGYHVIYGNDNWGINKNVTINAGLRWEEEQLDGPNQQYTFNDNWSPRLGINIDPRGDRKSKVFFNWGRYTQSLPSDAAIRELNQESDIYYANYSPEADANNNVVIGPNGTVVPVLDAAHLLSGNPAAGGTGQGAPGFPVFTQGSIPELVAPQTKLNYEEEYVAGLEKQYKGFVFSARYTDRRLLRIIEDMSGASPEGYFAGVPQLFRIGNPNSKSDYFVNEQEQVYTYNAALPNGGAPANCPANSGQVNDTYGNPLPQAVCILNPANADYTAGAGTYLGGTDGKPDGAPNARRHYQSVEVEANKNFSHNFLVRANYRFANLWGNYEGLARNDNGQFDPGISSLYDFTQGALKLLGYQYVPGWLNTDRRHSGNLYASYVVPSGFAKNLTSGIGLRGSSGIPITGLGAHPAYQNAGEIPLGPRGYLGREPVDMQLDTHTDYTLPLGEKYKFKVAWDMFNVTNTRTLTSKDQDLELTVGVNNADYLKPESFQRAFYARGSVRIEF